MASPTFTTRVLSLTTGRRESVTDLTGACEEFLAEAAAGRDGLLNLFVPHATAGLAVLETGSGSDSDLLATLHHLLPADDRWQHRHGSPGHGRDHVLPAFLPPHATLPVIAGRLALGTWQSVCLVESRGSNRGNHLTSSGRTGGKVLASLGRRQTASFSSSPARRRSRQARDPAS